MQLGPILTAALKANKPMTREEEVVAVAQARMGNQRARDRLVMTNLRQVAKIARPYARGGVPLDDAMHYGIEGLLAAIEKFEPERGLRLVTFAAWWIRAQIQRGIFWREAGMRGLGGSGVPGKPLAQASMDDDEVAAALVSDATQSEMSERLQTCSEVRRRLERTHFTPRERTIIRRRLLAHDRATLEEIATEYSVSRERIRQMEIDIKAKLERVLADLAA